MSYALADMMRSLALQFPTDFPDQATLDERTKVFRARFAGIEGDRLERAMVECLARWNRVRCPWPEDIAKCLPPPEVEKQDRHAPDRYDWAALVMRSDDGQIAIRDGYARELYLWAVANPGRIVTADTLAACAEGELRFRRALAAFAGDLKGRVGALDRMNARHFQHVAPCAALCALEAGNMMRAKESQLAREFKRRDDPPVESTPPGPYGL